MQIETWIGGIQMNIGIITGASSGMGKEFVKLTMQNHLDLDEIWVIARRKERLEAWPSCRCIQPTVNGTVSRATQGCGSGFRAAWRLGNGTGIR